MIRLYFLLIIILGTCACTTPVLGQLLNFGGLTNGLGGSQRGGSSSRSSGASSEEDPCIPLQDARRCWTIDPMTGLTYPSIPDTAYLDMARTDAMESHALAVAYTGNLFSPHQSEQYFSRLVNHDFLFANAYNFFRARPEDILFYNTRLPFTVAAYSKSGGNLQENDRLKLRFAGNFNSRLGVGSSLDYVYARGEYVNQAAKPLKWLSYLYYEGEQYKAYLTFNLSKLANQENGGVLNREYVLNPDAYETTFTEARTMPTKLTDTWNDTRQRQVHFTHSYDLGRWEERRDPADTSSVWDELVPIGTIFHTIDFESLSHNFRMDTGADATENGFFANHYYSTDITNDSTTYRNFQTYAGIRLNEGFSRFSQFSLSAFVGYERQHYQLMQDSLDLSYIPRKHMSNNVWLGGQISRHQSSILTLDATARTAVSGDKVGDVEIDGQISSVIPFGRRIELGRDSLTQEVRYGRKDSIIVRAGAQMRNSRVSYMMNHYWSNHFRWSNDFSREQRVRLEGELAYPRSGTSAKVGIEHINNFHYFGADFLPHEYDKQLDVFSLEIGQKLAAGPLHWDNRLLIQTSTDDEVLALPSFSIESDLNIRFRIARVLWTQVGVTGWYHTKYYAPNYQPATQQFAMQHETKCGGFPVLNGYVNANLKRIKFFIVMHNMLNQAVTNDIFIMPDYPMMPRRFEWGITLDLQN